MSPPSRSQVASMQLNVAHRAAMQVVQRANFIAGEGIDGDRHASPRAERQGYQVLLMDEETLAALGLSAGQVRENVTTNGIDLASLAVGQRIALGGQTVLQISKPCAPCSRRERRLSPESSTPQRASICSRHRRVIPASPFGSAHGDPKRDCAAW